MYSVSERRFGGVARVYGTDALNRFGRAKVTVIGVGGVGSWAVEALARSGIGSLVLIDLDHIVESNINRQLQAVEPDLGKAKVLALAERVAQINPQCLIETQEMFLQQDNIEQLIAVDNSYVVDCIDNYRVKAALIVYCHRNKIPVIVSGGAGGRIDPTQVRIADLSRTEQDPLLSRTRKLLRQDYGFSHNPKRRFNVPCVFSPEQQRHPEDVGAVCNPLGVSGLSCAGFGSAMTVTATFGLVAVSHVLKKLAESETDSRAGLR
jgi:tRNA A37 threonylcarbamoyladenosine dehydratase